jgi:hypothetical protein
MAQFAPMMSPENPALGAASSAASGAMQLARSLRSAAQQQQQVQAQKDKQSMAEQLDMARLVNEGWQVYEPSSNVQGEPGKLKTRDYTPPPANMVTLPTIGKQLYRPDQTAQQKQAQQRQGFTDLRTMLDQGAEPYNGGNVNQDRGTPRARMDAGGNVTDTGEFGVNTPPDPGRLITPPGGYQRYYMPPKSDLLADRLHTEAAAKEPTAPTVDTEHFSAPVSIDHRTGKVTALTLPDGVTHDDKTPKYTYNHFTDDAGRVNVTRIGADGVPQKWDGNTWAALEGNAALGPKRKDPDAAKPEKQATPAQLNAVEGKKRAGLVRAEVAYKKAMKDATVGGYTDPDAAKAAGDALLKGKQDAQDAYEQALTEYGKPVEHVDYASQPEAAPAKAATAAAGGGRGTAGGGGRVRVKLPDGRTGTVDAGEFDAKTMTKL